MRTFLTIVSLVVGLLSFSPAALAGDECEPLQQVCIATLGDSGSTKAPVDNMVCVWFSQEQAGEVMIVLYADAPQNESVHVGTQVLFEKTRSHPERSKYCFGPQRLDGVVWLMICNDRGHATRGIPSLIRLRQEGEIDIGFLG